MINRQLTIDGRNICIINDFVGDVTEVENESQSFSLIESFTGIKADCFVNEGELQDARDKTGHVEIYGLWQLVISNSLITEAGDYFVADSGKPKNGHLLRVEDQGGRLVVHGSTPVIGGVVRFAGGSIEASTQIDLDVGELEVPEQKCQLVYERLKEVRDRARQGWTVTILFCVIVAVLSAVVWYADQLSINAKIEEIAAQKLANAEMLNKIQFLKANRISKVENYSPMINTLAMLFQIDDEVTTIEDGQNIMAINSFSSQTLTMISDNQFRFNVFATVPNVSSKLTPEGRYLLRTVK